MGKTYYAYEISKINIDCFCMILFKLSQDKKSKWLVFMIDRFSLNQMDGNGNVSFKQKRERERERER